MTKGPSKDSDQPGHLPILIKVFAVSFFSSLGPKPSLCRHGRLWQTPKLISDSHVNLLVYLYSGSILKHLKNLYLPSIWNPWQWNFCWKEAAIFPHQSSLHANQTICLWNMAKPFGHQSSRHANQTTCLWNMAKPFGHQSSLHANQTICLWNMAKPFGHQSSLHANRTTCLWNMAKPFGHQSSLHANRTTCLWNMAKPFGHQSSLHANQTTCLWNMAKPFGHQSSLHANQTICLWNMAKPFGHQSSLHANQTTCLWYMAKPFGFQCCFITYQVMPSLNVFNPFHLLLWGGFIKHSLIIAFSILLSIEELVWLEWPQKHIPIEPRVNLLYNVRLPD